MKTDIQFYSEGSLIKGHLYTVATGDTVNPPEESYRLYELANEPKALFEIENATHYEVYEGFIGRIFSSESCRFT